MEHKEDREDRVLGEVQLSMWQSLIQSWHSLLGSGDYAASLSVDHVAVLSPEKIRELGANLCMLDSLGMGQWSDEQLLALSADQLSYLTDSQVEIVASCAPAALLRRWFAESPSPGVFLVRHIPAIIRALGDDNVRIVSVAEGLQEREDIRAASRILLELLRYFSDEEFSVFSAATDKGRLQAMLAADVRPYLDVDDDFKERLDTDYGRYVKSKLGYQHHEVVYQEALEELEKIGRRLELAQSRPVRERIYSEFQEWLHELPISGLARMLLSAGKVEGAGVCDSRDSC